MFKNLDLFFNKIEVLKNDLKVISTFISSCEMYDLEYLELTKEGV